MQFDQESFNLPEQLNAPETTTAVIQQYVPQIADLWDVGTQMATPTGEPYSRTYSLLSFPENEASIDIVPLGYYSDDYEGTSYYLVAHHFLEDSYTASVDPAGNSKNNFLRWYKTTTRYRQEITYSHKVVNTVPWNRPSVPIQVSEDEEVPHYLDLPSDPYKLPLLFVGGAVAATVAVTPANSQIEVRLRSSATDHDEAPLQSGLILLTKPYLEIILKNIGNSTVTQVPTLVQLDPDDPASPYTTVNVPSVNNSAVTHTKVTVTFYGKYKWRSFTPISTEDERTLIHPVNAPLETKLKPPGHPELPDNFWNSHPNPIQFENFFGRAGSPAWV